MSFLRVSHDSLVSRVYQETLCFGVGDTEEWGADEKGVIEDKVKSKSGPRQCSFWGVSSVYSIDSYACVESVRHK